MAAGGETVSSSSPWPYRRPGISVDLIGRRKCSLGSSGTRSAPACDVREDLLERGVAAFPAGSGVGNARRRRSWRWRSGTAGAQETRLGSRTSTATRASISTVCVGARLDLPSLLLGRWLGWWSRCRSCPASSLNTARDHRTRNHRAL